MITILLGGLWHGASWTFVVWGALHGLYLWVEKAFQDLRKTPALQGLPVTEAIIAQASLAPALPKNKNASGFMLALATFFLVNVTWVFFRAPDFTSAWRLLNSLFGHVSNGTELLTTLAIIKVSVIIGLLVIVQWFMRNTRILVVAGKMPWWLLGITWTVMLLLLILCQESSSSFIYFQF
jgi:D-alanyl-lipoteichoic acid acyltransferase DltB (MBOAT superfamily)